ncbi:hypothetical protein EDB19DRAFT_1731834 [Suillus lakei]|nr:hypothetical protein EDB19DRAFT_1731834 [Suillus lakei]
MSRSQYAVRHVVFSYYYLMLIPQQSPALRDYLNSMLAVLRRRPILKGESLLTMAQRCPNQVMFRPHTNTYPAASKRSRKIVTSLTTRIERNSQAMRCQQKMGRITRNGRIARTGGIMSRSIILLGFECAIVLLSPYNYRLGFICFDVVSL